MNYKEIKMSSDETFFEDYSRKKLFGRTFDRILAFHDPGVAAVMDFSGAYHIDSEGRSLYSHRFFRTFGFYEGRAAVVDANGNWFHIGLDRKSTRLNSSHQIISYA